jgi:putative ABC transport system substrate-binding protein
MDRRSILLAALGTAIARFAAAQPASRVYRIGFLGISDPTTWAGYIASLRLGFRELGYVEGKNLVIEFRWAYGDPERLSKLAAELVDAKVDVIVTHGTPGSRAAKAATRTVPIVMAASGDPLRSGLVESLARPGGNLTGTSIVEPDLTLKRLELVKEVTPKVTRVAVLYAAGTQLERAAEAADKNVADAGAKLNLQARRIVIRASNELAATFVTLAKEGTGALVVGLDALLAANYSEIVRLADQHRIATFGGARQFVDAGGLFAYGVNVQEAYRHAAVYVDKILKGARPADLPIEQPMKIELIVNLKAAKTFGLAVPQSVLLRATEVIE